MADLFKGPGLTATKLVRLKNVVPYGVVRLVIQPLFVL
jgi:hypothetical protein